MPSLNTPVRRLKVAILPQDLPCSGPVTHSGEILTTGESHGKKPDRTQYGNFIGRENVWKPYLITFKTAHSKPNIFVYIYIYIYIGFKTLYYVVRHLDSTASYLSIGLHLGFFRSWPSLYLPSSFSSVSQSVSQLQYIQQ